MLGQSFLYAARGLAHRKLRSWLTMLGIFIGIAAVVALISLSEGLKVAIDEQFSKIGADKIFVLPKGTFGGFESDAARLTVSDKDRLARIPGVDEATTYVFKAGLISLEDENVPVYVTGIPEDAQERALSIEIGTWEIESGKWFDGGDGDKVVIGNDFARTEILDDRLKLGDSVKVNDGTFEVVGILTRIGDPSTDGGVFIDEDMMRDAFGLDDEETNFIGVRLQRGADIAVVQERMERELRKAHDVDEGKEDFEVQSPEELLATFTAIFNIIQAVLIGIAAISLLVGGIGIMNTMYTAVLERTQEIGVMKAVGARNRDILSLFLFESGLLGMAGGVVGIVLGMGLSKGVELVASQVFGSPLIRAFFPIYLIVGALAFAFFVGVLSGVLPAYQAARLQPVDALRYE
ncbi:ABC transporter permease [Candidatus Woesearchaeota archaeon]|nr:ABC transporter permease [Candidatus Woesearchaeota archaeon]